MRRSPSIVPHGADCDTHVVLNDFGKLGRAWCEVDEQDTDRKTLIRRLMEDQYNHPVRIVAFNTAEGWSRDVTVDIADELRRRFAEYDEVPCSVQEFLEIAVRR
jgi:hypothetical protein